MNTALSLGAFPPSVLASTVVDTTRGLLRNELLANTDEIGGTTPNISSDGRLDGGEFPASSVPGGQVYLENPFLGESGELIVYQPTGILVGIEVEPAPLPVVLSVPGDRLSETFVVRWFGTAELFYQVQVATTLTPADWTNLGDAEPGTGAEITAEVGTTAEPRFFCVISASAP